MSTEVTYICISSLTLSSSTHIPSLAYILQVFHIPNVIYYLATLSLFLCAYVCMCAYVHMCVCVVISLFLKLIELSRH